MYIFNFKRWPKSFLLAAFFVVIIETGQIYFDNQLYLDINLGVLLKLKNHFSLTPGNDFDILVLGDCYNQTGIAPGVIEEVTGLKTFNFSSNAYQTILSSYLMLENYLRVNPKKPRYLIVSFLPEVWTQSKKKIIDTYLFNLSDFVQDHTPLFIKEFGLARTLKLYLPTLKHQDLLKRVTWPELRYRWENKKKADSTILTYLMNWKGVYFPWEEEEKYVVEDVPQECSNPFVADEFFIKYFQAILDLSRRNNIEVVYVMPAQPPEWLAFSERCGTRKDSKEFLEAFQKRYPNLRIAAPQGFLNEEFFYHDRLHLNYQGAWRLSSVLGFKIKELEAKN